jgi:UDP-N-acetylglucosamine 2-epimerase (non-hydrolysing)
VDVPRVLKNIVEGLIKSRVPFVLSLHPRTRKRLVAFGFLEKLQCANNIQIIPPQGYLDFLTLMKHCTFIVTDSGGIQEEATSPALSKRTLVLRLSTERQEAVEVGISKLVRLEASDIANEVAKEWDSNKEKIQRKTSSSPYGAGYASEKIVDILKNFSLPAIHGMRE